LKFPHEGTEVTIISDLDPFEYFCNLEGIPKCPILVNQEASSSISSHYVDPTTLQKPSTIKNTIPDHKVEI
jgi:hypothetical protein